MSHLHEMQVPTERGVVRRTKWLALQYRSRIPLPHMGLTAAYVRLLLCAADPILGLPMITEEVFYGNF